MAGPLRLIRQRDFSGGQVNANAKRRDDEAVIRSSTRECRNAQLLAPGCAKQRPGRRIRFSQDGRVDQVRMSPSDEFQLCFGDGTLQIRDSDDVLQAQAWGYDWTTDTVDQIVWDVFSDDVIICFPGQVTKVARWDGDDWTFLDYAPRTADTSAGAEIGPDGALTAAGTSKQAAFYRFAKRGITMELSGLTGSVTVTFSDDVLVSGHVGSRFRYYDKQVTITAVTSPTVGTATVNEVMREVYSIEFNASIVDQFSVGDTIEGTTSGLQFYVADVGSLGTEFVIGIRLNSSLGAVETFVGPSGQGLVVSSALTLLTTGPAITVWDEEVMSDYRGWPQSVTADQNRIIFCDLPGLPGGIVWSAVGDPYDVAIGAAATDGFLELAPGKCRVLHVRPGADEFVFTDLGVYYIPISVSNPLRPGSVVFQRIPGPPSSRVEPVSTSQGLVYVGTGLNRIIGIVGTGQTAQPYLTRPASDLQSDLFSGIFCIEVEDSGGDPPEDRVYAVNADGSVVVGRYQPGKEWVGWVPWDGDGTVAWISALASDLLFTTVYDFGSFCEEVDTTLFLDAAVFVGDPPAVLAAGAQSDVMIGRNQGTVIGNMTAAGGLAAAFNGTTSELHGAAASKTASTTGSVGKTLAQAMKIAKAEVYPSFDFGFTDQANVTVSLCAKTGAAPVNFAVDGTQLATTGSIADTGSMQTLTSNDLATEWDHVWVLLTISSGATYVAEVKFYSAVESNGTGDLWFLNSGTFNIMDGRLLYGERTITAGAIDVQPGDDFSSDTVVAGLGWDVIVEPFLPHAESGQHVGQAIESRQLGRVGVAVSDSTGFLCQKWNPNTGAWEDLNDHFTDIRGGENPDAEPPAREESGSVGAGGSGFDPRWRVIKNFPGPVTFEELVTEIGG